MSEPPRADDAKRLYLCIARYAPDADLVAAARSAHRAYARDLRAAGRLLAGGPFADGSGAVLIYEAGSPQEVQDLIARDPFQQRGVFADVEVKEWNLIEDDLRARLTAREAAQRKR